ncbi:MAG: folate-binding protein [Pseudomonadota bacterium]
MERRRVLIVTGTDRVKFLDGLVTNRVPTEPGHLVYAALLTPQGKFLADFFILSAPDRLLIDAPDMLADDLTQRLSMYRLRADVRIGETELHVHRGLGTIPADGHADPRHAELGWRAYRKTPAEDDDRDWDALRVAHLVPATGIELTPDTYILEAGFERLNGVDFHKGCYVGQEVTARMKHKTELRKGLARVSVIGSAVTGTKITANEKPVGLLFTRAGDRAIAYLRFERAQGPMRAGAAEVRLLE